jgi:hypothetical protein
VSDTSLTFSVLARDKVSRVLGAIGGAFRNAGRQAEDSLNGATVDSARLDAELHRVESSLKELNREFARTGDKELFAKMKRDRSLLANLRKIKEELGGVGRAADDAGDRSSRGFTNRWKTAMGWLPGILGSAMGSLPPMVSGPVAIAGAAIGLALAAAIGAAVAAGVLLAVGGGVLAAGIMQAVKDPKVGAAWKTFGERAKKALAGFSDPFKGPLIRAAKTFGDSLTRMAPTLKAMGQSMAPIIDKLAPALASMAEKALPGIQHAMEASKPLFDVLAEKAPEIGEAIGKFFDKMALAGPGAVLFLKDFIGWVIWLIGTLGNVILALSKIYEAVHSMWSSIKIAFATGVAFILAVIGQIIGGAAAAFGWMPGIGPKLKTAAAQFSTFAARANASLAAIRDKEVTITISRHEAMFGKPGTSIGGIGGTAFKGLASGGPFQRGQVNWVGENGPELVRWGGSGTVIPADTSAAMSRGASSGGRAGGTIKVIVIGGDQQAITEFRRLNKQYGF